MRSDSGIDGISEVSESVAVRKTSMEYIYLLKIRTFPYIPFSAVLYTA
jgi:glutamate racemase